LYYFVPCLDWNFLVLTILLTVPYKFSWESETNWYHHVLVLKQSYIFRHLNSLLSSIFLLSYLCYYCIYSSWSVTRL
jgi:hypothetical protein